MDAFGFRSLGCVDDVAAIGIRKRRRSAESKGQTPGQSARTPQRCPPDFSSSRGYPKGQGHERVGPHTRDERDEEDVPLAVLPLPRLDFFKVDDFLLEFVLAGDDVFCVGNPATVLSHSGEVVGR